MSSPNTSLQRTRAACFARTRSPLSSQTLGDAKSRWAALGSLGIAVVLFLAAGEMIAQESGGGAIVYGSNYAFAAAAPKGWVGQCPPPGSEGPAMMYWPKESTWKDSPVVMYINVLDRSESRAKDLAGFIDWELAEYRKTSPKLVAKSEKAIQLSGGKEAQLRRLQDGRGNYELVAYIQETSVVSVFVVSGRDAEVVERSSASFRELIDGYKFLTDNVVIK